MTTEPRIWLVLADATLATHALCVLFIVCGQIAIVIGWGLGWMWTRRFMFRLLHLIAIGFVMLEAWFSVTCPLTIVENVFRSKAGTATYDRSFISHWLERLIFYAAPEWVFTLIYTVFAGLVILTWLAYPPRRKYW